MSVCLHCDTKSMEILDPWVRNSKRIPLEGRASEELPPPQPPACWGAAAPPDPPLYVGGGEGGGSARPSQNSFYR